MKSTCSTEFSLMQICEGWNVTSQTVKFWNIKIFRPLELSKFDSFRAQKVSKQVKVKEKFVGGSSLHKLLGLILLVNKYEHV